MHVTRVAYGSKSRRYGGTNWNFVSRRQSSSFTVMAVIALESAAKSRGAASAEIGFCAEAFLWQLEAEEFERERRLGRQG